MKKTTRRLLSILMAICMLMSTCMAAPLTVGAESRVEAVAETPVVQEAAPDAEPEAPAAEPEAPAAEEVAPDAEPEAPAAEEEAPAAEPEAPAVQEEAPEQNHTDEETPAEANQETEAASSPAVSPAAEAESGSASGQSVTESRTASSAASAASSAVSEAESVMTYPAQSFTGRANGVTVRVSAGEGVFPERTAMTVRGVSSSTALRVANAATDSETEVVDAVGVDITFRDAAGAEIEPKDGRSVHVSMTVGSALEGESFAVVHQSDSGSAEMVSENATATAASFAADSFSVYVIAGIGTPQQDPAVATYVFHDADGNEISAQKVKDGETVYAPTTPEKSGSKFLGWSYTQNAAQLQDGDPGAFSTLKPSVTKTAEIKLYPVFQSAYYVFFLDNQGRVSTTKEGVSEDNIDVADVTIPLDSTHSVTGWYTEAELINKVESVTLSDHNVTLYPKVEEGHYLYFSSGEGASYVKPVFVAAGKNTVKPEAPTRPGYTFKHWSASEGGYEYAFGSTISEDTTLYAVWEANTNTKYTVIYWWENANDSNYSYHENSVETGTAGNKIDLTGISRSYDGFTLNTEKTNAANADAVIAGDGSTIVNVYYSRKTYKIKFFRATKTGSWWNPSYSWNEMENLRISAKYGANISNRWPTSTSKIWGTKQGSDGQGAQPYQSGISTMPLGGASFYYVEQSGTYTMNLHYYLEGLDGTYSLHHTDSFKSNNNRWTTTEEDHYDIEGFTYTNNVKDGSAFEGESRYVYKVSFKYSRNSYSIKFVNGNSTTSETFKYGADISKVDLTTAPERPAGIPSDYIFAGWFDNELGVGNPATLTGTMPAHNITLYAKWAAPTYKGIVHTTIDGTGTPMQLTINYGSKINENDMPTVKDADGNIIQEGSSSYTVTVPKGNTWAGWATKSGDDYIIYNFGTEVYSDITLYPYYINGEKYTVTYSLGEGTGTAPTDSKQYSQNAYADIQPASGITPPEGKTFLYWNTEKDSTGTAYYPGDKIRVESSLTLYAIYGDPAKTTTLTYHANYPGGTAEQTVKQKVNGSETLENNASFRAYSAEQAGFAADGYYFSGWNTSADGKGTAVEAGAEIGVDVSSENHLYAQWEKKKALAIQITGNTDTKLYNGKKQIVTGYTITYTLDGTAIETLPGHVDISGPEAAAVGADAGTYYMDLAEKQFALSGSDLYKYTVTLKVTDGSLTILPRDVKLVTEGVTRAYNGQPLTNGNYQVSGKGFVEGEVSDLHTTGSQTAVGSSKNTITYTKGEKFKDSNYIIEEELGVLEVTASTAAFGIKANNSTKMYDGKALTDSGYTVSKPEGFEAYTVTAKVEGTITDAGKTDNRITSYQIADPDGTDVTAYFTGVTRIDGTLEVKKRPLTLISETATKAYDGTALTGPDVKVEGKGGSFVDGELKSLTATGSQTEVGSSENNIEYEGTDKFKKDNYDITLKPGTLTVTTNSTEITVTANSAEKVYDGTPLTNTGYRQTGLPAGFTLSVTVSGSATNVVDTKEGNNEIKSVSVLKDGKDVTAYFTGLKTVNGTLTVKPKTVRLASASDSKEYDGTPLTNPTVTAEEGYDFVGGEAEATATGTVTEVGSVENTIRITGKPDAYKASNYSITETPGTLTVRQNSTAITVTAKSGTKVYDGMPLTFTDAAEPADVKGLPDGFTFSVTVSGSVTDVTDAPVSNHIESFAVLDGDGKNVTDQFSGITKTDGTLQITKRTVTLTSESASKPYDGTALTRPDVTGGDDFVKGEVSGIRATGTVTTVEEGEVKNTIEYTAGNSFKPGNYEIVKNEGKLWITAAKIEFTVTSPTETFLYDGTEHTAPECKVTYPDDAAKEAYTVTASATGKVKDVEDGTVTNTIGTIHITENATGKDVTNQFDPNSIGKSEGTLTVRARAVTLATKSATKAYDGTALTEPGVTIGGDGFVDGEVTGIQATGSITKVGEAKNTITYTTQPGFRAKNYIITVKQGTLTVTKSTAKITVTANSAEKMYDGTALTDAGYTVTGLPDSFSVSDVSVTGSATKVSDTVSGNNKITGGKIRNSKNEDVTDQFEEITLVDGTLTVTKRSVTLTSETASKPYDGAALTRPDVTVSGDGFVTGEVEDIKATGSVTNAGESAENKIAYTPVDGKFDAGNYDITIQEGTLTVTKNGTKFVITAPSESWTYDGKAHTAAACTVRYPEGDSGSFTVTASASGSITDAGSTGNPVDVSTIKIVDGAGNDVTAHFDIDQIEIVAGTLTVAKRSVTLTSETASKPYDGTALTRPYVTVTGDGFVDGEVKDVKATGTITKEGNVPNSIVYTEQKAFKASNYEITKNEGTLVITQNTAAITVTAASEEKTYDGTALISDRYEITGLPEGFAGEVTLTGSVTNVEDNKADNHQVAGVVIRNSSGEDVTDQFSGITKVNGTLAIKARSVMLTSESFEREYDGTPLTRPDVTVSGDGFVDGEVKDVRATGMITSAGSVTNAIAYEEQTAFKASNYGITKNEGKLTITKNTAAITVTAASAAKMYDGTALTDDGYTVDGLPEGFTLKATVKGSITNADDTTNQNTVTQYTITKNDDAGQTDVSANFANVTKKDGTLGITPRKVTLESPSGSKAYDGKPLTRPDVTVSGDGFVDGEVTGIRATGTITETGSVPNKIEYEKQAAFRASNYTITEKPGTLTVTRSRTAFVVTADSHSWIYDGQAHTDSGFSVVSPAGAPEGYTVEATVEGSVTNVKENEVANQITKVVIRDADGKDVTAQFDEDAIVKNNGVLRIEPKPVTLTSESATREYDGTVLSRPIVTGADAFVGTEVTDAKATGSITKTGSVPNTITYKTGAGFDRDNYTILLKEGTLTITPNTAAITVTAASEEKTYDGKALTNGKYTAEGLPEGFTLTAAVNGSITDWKDNAAGNNKITSITIMKDREDVTDQFSGITRIDGTMKIVKRSVTLKSETKAWSFDGKYHTAPDVTVSGEGFVDGEVSELKATGRIRKAGSVVNAITYTKEAAYQDDNYRVTLEEGTLYVTKNDTAFIVTADSASWSYDGQSHSDSGFTVQKLDPAYTVQAKVTGSVKNVSDGTVKNHIEEVKIFLGTEDVTDQFAEDQIVREDGLLSVTPRVITLTSKSGSKPYDGTALTLPDVDVDGEIVKSGATGEPEIRNIRATGSVTYETAYPVPNTIEYDTSEAFAKTNYTIFVKTGTLEITRNMTPVTVRAADASKTYDGTPLTAGTAEVTGLPNGFTGTGTATGSITNVPQNQEGNNPVGTWRIFDSHGKDVSNQFGSVTEIPGTLTIQPRKMKLKSADAEKVFDGKPLTKEEVEVVGDGLADGDEISYAFTGTQTYAGESDNTFTYQLAKKQEAVQPAPETNPDADDTVAVNYEIETSFGRLKVTDDADPALVVTKTHDGKAYQPGEEIVFRIQVTNIYDSARTIRLIEQDGVVIKGESVFKDVQPGATVTADAVHVVTAEDVANGSYTNHVTAHFDGSGKEFGAEDKVDSFAHLTLAKKVTSRPANGSSYALGETIRYDITAKNEGTTALEEVKIEDALTGESWTADSLAAGESRSFETSWTVTEEDIRKGHVSNVATGSAKAGDGDPVVPDPGKADEPTESPNPGLYLEKTSDKEGEVKLGETLKYTVRVLNNGNETLTDVTVTDEMTGDVWEAGTLKPGESRTFETKYTVTEADLRKGSVLNRVTATGKDPDGKEPPVVPGETENPTEPAKAHLTLKKTTTSRPENAAGYAAGEKITYRIEAVNDGNQTLTDVKVTDELTGGSWTIDSLKPGETKTFETSYTVTEKDMTVGHVINEATAAGKDPDGKEPPVTPGETEDPTKPAKAHLTLTKKATSQPKNAAGYAVGETITYRIEAANDGNVTLTDVKVTDALTGGSWTVESMAPGETKSFETSYVVTENDRKNGRVVNVATATGKDPADHEPTVVPGETEDPVRKTADSAAPGGGTAAPSAKVTSVKTGDASKPELYLILLLAALAAAAGAGAAGRKKRRG